MDELDTPKQAQDAAAAIVEPEEPGPEQEVQEKPAVKSIQMVSELRLCMRAQVARSHSRY